MANDSPATNASQERYKELLGIVSAAIDNAYIDMSTVESQLMGRKALEPYAKAWEGVLTTFTSVFAEPGNVATSLALLLADMNNKILPAIVNEHYTDKYRKEKVERFKNDQSNKAIENEVAKLIDTLGSIKRSIAYFAPRLSQFVEDTKKDIDVIQLKIIPLEDSRSKDQDQLDDLNDAESKFTEQIRDDNNEIEDLKKDRPEGWKEMVAALEKEIQRDEQALKSIPTEALVYKLSIANINEDLTPLTSKLRDFKVDLGSAQSADRQLEPSIEQAWSTIIQDLPLLEIWQGVNTDADAIIKYINDGYPKSSEPAVISQYKKHNKVYPIVRRALSDFASSVQLVKHKH